MPTPRAHRLRTRAVAPLLPLLLGACAGDKGGSDSGVPGGGSLDLTTFAADHAALTAASYADSRAGAEALQAALTAFVAAPGEPGLQAAREAWLDSREPYLQTEVHRFYDGPIDNPTDGPEGLINAWPLDEQYIDFVVGDEDAGLVNGDGPIDADALVGANEAGGEKNIATGYHAIEFLLWGQDLSSMGPGARPATDFATDGSASVPNPDRRGQYLTVAGQLLVDHLTQVEAQWAPGASYRAAFEADGEGALEKALTGMIILAGFETGGERLQAALDSGDQEDEHSCFSDNTHRDMIQDIQGIANVWEGRYVAVDGSVVEGLGVRELVVQTDHALADEVSALITAAQAAAAALQPPFDQEIAPGSPGNERVLALVQACRALEEALFVVFDRFGLSVTVPE